ncbi:MAG TPA: hypothetical protein VLF09_07925 [Cellvibrio sp.]|nr:hypothetical protein [Cellvibrio sp.]
MKKTLAKSSWDAVLDTSMCDKYTNAELTITIKLGFKQINPAAGALTGTYNDYGDPRAPARKIDKWTKNSWEAWKLNFVQSAQKYWDGKFWLINNFSLMDLQDNGVKYIPNVWCRFKLQGADATPGFKSHHTIEVVRLNKSETWFGSHSRLFDSLDTKSVAKGTDSKGRSIMQKAHVHEVGHLLGLPHVDVGKSHCPPSNTNSSACYGVADTDKYAVMGQGMQLRDSNANPWRQAMIDIFVKGNINLPSDWTPKQTRHYPRTLAEVTSKTLITKKPTR